MRSRAEKGSIVYQNPVKNLKKLFYWHVKNGKVLEQGWELSCINSDQMVVAAWRAALGGLGPFLGFAGSSAGIDWQCLLG